jgi:iron complex outermembrane receptor protein
VEITGSSIVRKEQTQTLPVQVITRAEIQNSGKHDVAELVQALPLMSSFTSPADVGYVTGGANGAAIHGMQSGTVVLINGRRLAPPGTQFITGVNNSSSELNLLPLSAIDRIEILTDGASSIYGSDALAGVVNIITRSERPGVEITAEHRLPEGGKGKTSRVDLSAGGGRLLKDGYSWFIAADVSHQQALAGSDRAYASQGRYAIQQDGKNYWAYDPQLSLAQTGTTLSNSADGVGTKSWSAQYQNGQCARTNVPVYGQQGCYYSQLLQTDLTPKVDVARFHGQGQWMVDAANTAFAEFGYQTNKQVRLTRPWAPYTAQIANVPGAPGHDLAKAHGLDPATGVWLNYSGSDLGLSTREFEMQSLRMTTGLKGAWNEWDYRGALYYSDNRMQYGSGRFTDYPNLGVDGQGFLTNPALLLPLSSGSPDSLALMSKLQSMRYWNDTSAGVTSLKGLELHASRSLGELDGRDILFAMGTDLRHAQEKFDTYNPAVTQPSFSGQRTIWAQFAEVQIPVLPTVEAIASLRNDHYSDFGNTTNAKFSAKWAPSEQWLLRGAIGTGFRAPAIAQLQPTGDSNSGSVITNTCTSALQAVAQKLGGNCPKDDNYWLYSQGNPDLKPEVSRHLNWGVRFSPSRNQSFWLDYWRVEIRDKINQLTDTAIMANPEKYASNFELNDQKELQMQSRMTNTGATQKSGIDFGWSLRQPTDMGQLQMRIGGTWITESRYKENNDSPWARDLNTYSKYDGYVVPRLRMQMNAGLNRQNWLFTGTVNYVHSHDDGGFTGINADTGESVQIDHHRVPSYWTLDVSARYEWSKQLKMRVGMDNVFNRRSPLSFGGPGAWNYSANPMYASLWGRTLNLATTYQF